MYNATDSAVKSEIRHQLFEEVIDNWSKKKDKKTDNHRKNILTLCNTSFEIENLLSGFGNVTCLEYDENIFKEAQKVKPKHVTLLNEDLFEHEHVAPYDFIWVDLCSSYSETILQKVIELIKTAKFNENSTFAITFTKTRGTINKSNLIKCYPKFKEKGVVQYIGNFFTNEITEVVRYDYNNFDISTRSMAMTLFVFKLGKTWKQQ